MDYYVPTPAIVKSGRLAPYSDLVYFVKPDESMNLLLKEKEALLSTFIDTHSDSIVLYLHNFLEKNYEKLKIKSLNILERYMRFVYTYKDESIDMSSYITGNSTLTISLEDIAKSLAKW